MSLTHRNPSSTHPPWHSAWAIARAAGWVPSCRPSKLQTVLPSTPLTPSSNLPIIPRWWVWLWGTMSLPTGVKWRVCWSSAHSIHIDFKKRRKVYAPCVDHLASIRFLGTPLQTNLKQTANTSALSRKVLQGLNFPRVQQRHHLQEEPPVSFYWVVACVLKHSVVCWLPGCRQEESAGWNQVCG